MPRRSARCPRRLAGRTCCTSSAGGVASFLDSTVARIVSSVDAPAWRTARTPAVAPARRTRTSSTAIAASSASGARASAAANARRAPSRPRAPASTRPSRPSRRAAHLAARTHAAAKWAIQRSSGAVPVITAWTRLALPGPNAAERSELRVVASTYGSAAGSLELERAIAEAVASGGGCPASAGLLLRPGSQEVRLTEGRCGRGERRAAASRASDRIMRAAGYPQERRAGNASEGTPAPTHRRARSALARPGPAQVLRDTEGHGPRPDRAPGHVPLPHRDPRPHRRRNYGGHVGNDAVLSIAHEARVRFLAAHGFAGSTSLARDHPDRRGARAPRRGPPG